MWDGSAWGALGSGFATGQALIAALDKTAGATSADALIPALEGLTWEGPKVSCMRGNSLRWNITKPEKG